MATCAPSSARRSAMPRPMRLAAPVTRMVLPARLESFMIVGRTPWSAADALVGLLRWLQKRVQGDPRGPGGPPYAVGSPWTSISSGSTPSRAGSGRRRVTWAQPQNIAVVDPEEIEVHGEPTA